MYDIILDIVQFFFVYSCSFHACFLTVKKVIQISQNHGFTAVLVILLIFEGTPSAQLTIQQVEFHTRFIKRDKVRVGLREEWEEFQVVNKIITHVLID